MPFEIEFLPVGDSNGDAITIRYGSDHTGYSVHVVDAGYTDTGRTVVDHINQYYGAQTRLDHVVLSHADRDHAGGLATVLEECDVRALWMNCPWLYAAEIVHRFHGNYTEQGLTKRIRDEYPILVDLEDIAIRRGIPVYEVFSGSSIGSFTVLAPSRQRYLDLIPELDRTPKSKNEASQGLYGFIARAADTAAQWFFETWNDEKLSENPPKTSASNESSVVQLSTLDSQRQLLTADAGPEALQEAHEVAQYLGMAGPVNFMQIPHHGSRRNVTPTVLNAWLGNPVPEGTPVRGISFVSVGTNKPKYPRNRVKNAFLRRGFTVNRGSVGWLRHYVDMPRREGEVPISSEPFSNAYEE